MKRKGTWMAIALAMIGSALAGPHNQETFSNGLRLVQEQQYEQALALFQANIRATPTADNIDYDYAWGMRCLAELRRYDEALAHYTVLRQRFAGKVTTGNVTRQWDGMLRQIRGLVARDASPEAQRTLAAMRALGPEGDETPPVATPLPASPAAAKPPLFTVSKATRPPATATTAPAAAPTPPAAPLKPSSPAPKFKMQARLIAARNHPTLGPYLVVEPIMAFAGKDASGVKLIKDEESGQLGLAVLLTVDGEVTVNYLRPGDEASFAIGDAEEEGCYRMAARVGHLGDPLGEAKRTLAVPMAALVVTGKVVALLEDAKLGRYALVRPVTTRRAQDNPQPSLDFGPAGHGIPILLSFEGNPLPGSLAVGNSRCFPLRRDRIGKFMTLVDYTQPLPETEEDYAWDPLLASYIAVECIPPADAVPEGEKLVLTFVVHNNSMADQIVYTGSVAWEISLEPRGVHLPEKRPEGRRREDYVTIPPRGTHTVRHAFPSTGLNALRLPPGEYRFSLRYSNSGGNWYGDHGKRGTVDAWDGHLTVSGLAFRVGPAATAAPAD